MWKKENKVGEEHGVTSERRNHRTRAINEQEE
jgi:hypothetical protein